MSIKVMDYVWENSTQKGSNKLMLLAIADNANENGDAFPGVPRLAHKCSLSERQAQVVIQLLERAGELQVFEGVGAQTSSGWTNLYRIVMKDKTQPSIRDHEGKLVLPRPPKELTKREFPKVDEVKPASPLDEAVKPASPDEVKPASPDEVKPASPKPSLNPSLNPNPSPDGEPARPQNLMYNAIRDIWHYEGALNGVLAGMLEGRAKQKGYVEYNLVSPVTADEIQTWARWYRQTELKGRTDLNILADPMKLSSSIAYWQSIGKPDPAKPKTTKTAQPATPTESPEAAARRRAELAEAMKREQPAWRQA
jgi:hypothetical protein